MAKNKKEIPLKIPIPEMGVNQWLIFGLDPSMSRTGYALMHVKRNGDAKTIVPEAGTRASWLAAGSVKPETASDPIWIRGKMMAMHLREIVTHAADVILDGDYIKAGKHLGDEHICPTPECCASDLGLIISMEYPTPMNDFLVALNRIIHLVFFENDMWKKFKTVRILTTNAATLRSLMGLTKTGAKNKGENILRAYDFIDKAAFPNLDSDACDAVLLSMMARHTSSILLGFPDEVPEKFKISLCNANQDVKGKGRNAKIVTKGLLHRGEYWYSYTRKTYTLCVKDASRQTNKLERIGYSI